mmetsp:Transcript_14258/g.56132  ORF Transcript_14258/g.56132 Transcript_14258/m.56132 type:complete len:424 (-) Transcript_14258:2442-3713(-)
MHVEVTVGSREGDVVGGSDRNLVTALYAVVQGRGPGDVLVRVGKHLDVASVDRELHTDVVFGLERTVGDGGEAHAVGGLQVDVGRGTHLAVQRSGHGQVVAICGDRDVAPVSEELHATVGGSEGHGGLGVDGESSSSGEEANVLVGAEVGGTGLRQHVNHTISTGGAKGSTDVVTVGRIEAGASGLQGDASGGGAENVAEVHVANRVHLDVVGGVGVVLVGHQTDLSVARKNDNVAEGIGAQETNTDVRVARVVSNDLVGASRAVEVVECLPGKGVQLVGLEQERGGSRGGDALVLTSDEGDVATQEVNIVLVSRGEEIACLEPDVVTVVGSVEDELVSGDVSRDVGVQADALLRGKGSALTEDIGDVPTVLGVGVSSDDDVIASVQGEQRVSSGRGSRVVNDNGALRCNCDVALGGGHGEKA